MWEKQNKAHYAMYKFIRNLHFSYANSNGELVSFEEMGKWKNDFVLDSIGAPQEAIKARACDVIFMFNRYIFDKYEVNFKTGENLESAINKLSEGFASDNSTVSTLGKILTELYEFSDFT